MPFSIFFPHWKDNTKVHYCFWSYLGILTKSFFLLREEKESNVIRCCNNVTANGKTKQQEFRDSSSLLESNTHSSSLWMIKSNLGCNTGNMASTPASEVVGQTLKNEEGLQSHFLDSVLSLLSWCNSIVLSLVFSWVQTWFRKGLETNIP